MEQFLKGETALAEQVRRVPDIKVYPLYECPIYLVTKPDDPLSCKELVTAEDLAGRTLMVGGPSPLALRFCLGPIRLSGDYFLRTVYPQRG